MPGSSEEFQQFKTYTHLGPSNIFHVPTLVPISVPMYLPTWVPKLLTIYDVKTQGNQLGSERSYCINITTRYGRNWVEMIIFDSLFCFGGSSAGHLSLSLSGTALAVLYCTDKMRHALTATPMPPISKSACQLVHPADEARTRMTLCSRNFLATGRLQQVK